MKILIVKASSLGDIIHVMPTLDFLRQKFPHAEINWVVEEAFQELVRAHPEVDTVLTVDTKQWRRGKCVKKFFEFRKKLRQTRYDLIFDFQGNLKSAFILVQARGKTKIGFGWKSAAEWPNVLFTDERFNPPKGKNIRQDYLYLAQSALQDFSHFEERGVVLRVKEEEKKAIDTLLQSLPSKKKVLVAPGAAWDNKIADPAPFLKKMEATFLFSWGNENEKSLSQALQNQFDGLLLPRYSLPALQYLMSRMDLVVAMDSLPLHLCGTTKTPTLSFFGPTMPAKYMPLGKHHTSVQGACPYKMVFEKRCPRLRTCQTAECIKEQNVP